MKSIKHILFAAIILATTFSCQQHDDLIPDPNAPVPVINDVQMKSTDLIYNNNFTFEVTISSEVELSHVDIQLEANNAIIFTKKIPAKNASELTIKDSLMLEFKELALNMPAELVVIATNKEFKTGEKHAAINLRRPDLGQIQFVPEDKTLAPIDLTASADDKYVYTATGSILPNNTTGFIISSTGFEWGFDITNKTAELGSTDPISLCNSESPTGQVGDIAFDVITFSILPQKQERTVNGVAFAPYKMNPEDEKVVDACLKATNVSLTQDTEVAIELIDLAEVMFDPTYFNVTDNKLFYKGESANVNLYLNTKYNFVFVEYEQATDVLFVNGWGIGTPTLWDYHPNWDFAKAITFNKVSETENSKTYAQTVVISKWATFKFYNGKDWGNELSPLAITYLNDDFQSAKEDDKDSYNIYTKDGDNSTYKSAIAHITFKVKDDNTYEFESTMIMEKDFD